MDVKWDGRQDTALSHLFLIFIGSGARKFHRSCGNKESLAHLICKLCEKFALYLNCVPEFSVIQLLLMLFFYILFGVYHSKISVSPMMYILKAGRNSIV